jgi:hypothetical protein
MEEPRIILPAGVERPNTSMRRQEPAWVKWAISASWAVVATVGALWGELVSDPLRVLIVAVCLVGILYAQAIRPRLAGFHVVHRADRRAVFAGVFASGLLVGAGLGGFVWLQFPREMTLLEEMRPRFSRCRDLATRPVSTAEEMRAYTIRWREWIIGTSDWLRETSGDSAAARFNDLSAVLPITREDDFNEDHQRMRNTVSKHCENLAAIMDSDGR